MGKTIVFFDKDGGEGVWSVANDDIKRVLCDDLRYFNKFWFLDRRIELFGRKSQYWINPHCEDRLNFGLKRVVFNNPATIAFWEDGTKTVVKCCEGDQYNKETGLAMCMLKKLMGESEYKKFFRRWCK